MIVLMFKGLNILTFLQFAQTGAKACHKSLGL